MQIRGKNDKNGSALACENVLFREETCTTLEKPRARQARNIIGQTEKNQNNENKLSEIDTKNTFH